MGKIVKYKMEMEVLTPVHIAGAEYKSKLNKKEYIYDEDKKILTLIDSNKFIKFLTEKGYFEKYLSYIETQANIKENKQDDLSKFLKENGIYENININKFKKKEYEQSLNTKNGITLVNRDVNGTSYIQGSSIKGALVNLLLVSYIIRNRNEFKDEISYIYSIIKKINNETKKKDMDEIKSKISNVVKNIEDQIFHKKEKIIIRNEKNVLTKRILRENDEKTKKFGISISDTYNTKDENFCFFKDYDEKLEENNQVKPMPVIREYINPKTRFIFDITLDFELLSETRLKINDFNDLINFLKKAMNYLIKNTLETPNDLGSQNLILGANTGFHQKTIIHALFGNEKNRLDVVKRLLHQSNSDKKLNHLIDDEFSPRVLNRIKIKENGELKSKLAGLVEIRKISQKEVGK
jgi:RAMP superfamily.